jgi:type I restriction enzyme, S subunit
VSVGYKPYGSYGLAPIPGLPPVPAHWLPIRLRFLIDQIEQGWSPQCANHPAAPDDWGVLKVGCVNGDAFNPLENKQLPADLAPETRYEIQHGDILMSRANTRELLGSAALVEQPRPRLLLCDKLYRLRVRDSVDRRFLVHSLRSRLSRMQYEMGATGASGSMQNVGQDTIKDLWVYLPPGDEQQAISRFLTQKAAQIDALIAKKQALLAKLAEKRTALIRQAVTKGLDPLAPTRESGVEWIGSIPAHWDCGNLRRFAQMKTGHTPSRSEAEYWLDCSIPWFSLADVWQLRDGKRKYLGDTKELISSLGLRNSAAELLPAGTVVFSRTASVGFSGIMPVPMATTQDFWNWICGKKLMPDYLLLVFRSMRQEIGRITSGSTHKTVYQGDAASLRVCVPPLSEQAKIVEFVESQTATIDGLSEKVVAAIDRLKEYRSSLITHAVTGQIDVRQVPIPEDPHHA